MIIKIIFPLLLFIFSITYLASEAPEQENNFDLKIQTVYSSENPDIIIARQHENGLTTLYDYDSEKRCTSKILRNMNGQLSRIFFHYDPQGLLNRTVVDDGQGEIEEDLTGVSERQIIIMEWGKKEPIAGKPLFTENLKFDIALNEELLVNRTVYIYSSVGDLVRQEFYDADQELVSLVENDENGIKFISDHMRESPQASVYNNHFYRDPKIQATIDELYSTSYTTWNDIWNNASHLFFEATRYLLNSAQHAKTALNAELSLPNELGAGLEAVTKTLIGNNSYIMMGLTNERTEIGCYSGEEINDKVRITFVNGILTTRDGMYENLKFLSESHGGAKIHYLFRPTEGWTWDVCRASLIRAAFYVGFRSWHSHLLAAHWRFLIHQLGGVKGGGTIIHYAHSLGGSETDRARELLTPEEQQMIRVITFGSATLIRSGGFQSVENNISVNDGVSSILLEPFGRVRNYFDPQTNVKFYGHALECFPGTDHILTGYTYSRLIKEYGKLFVQEFGSSDQQE
ncbi:MAG: hypothetical protein H0V82_04975 [Candidatus Protochlamydia sp.]|nr:hypothetical protein [Candidatus Protochlamydia sp.]